MRSPILVVAESTAREMIDEGNGDCSTAVECGTVTDCPDSTVDDDCCSDD